MERGKWLNGKVNVIEFISFESFMIINLMWLISKRSRIRLMSLGHFGRHVLEDAKIWDSKGW